MHLFPSTDWTKYPLHVAAMSGNVGEVERLLAAGADPKENILLEGTPLHIAIRHCQGSYFRVGRGHMDVIRLLLAAGSDLNASRLGSGTALHEAAASGDDAIAGILLENGADVNSKTEDHRRTPLHRAVAAYKPQTITFLLSKGADINAVADFVPRVESARLYEHCGMTPLHVAAKEGFSQIVDQLLAAGANKDLRVAKGAMRYEDFTALDLALDHRQGLERQIATTDELVKVLNNGVAFDPLSQTTLAREYSLFDLLANKSQPAS